MSRKALDSIYEEYRSELRSFFAHQSHHRQAVDDLVQEVYERLVRYPLPPDLKKPQNYLFKIAWNILNDANRRARLEERTTSCDPAVLERLASRQLGCLWIDDSEAELGAHERFESVLRELPPVNQVALLLQRCYGLSYEEIAQRMGISVHTVKKYIGQALTHFRNHYGESGLAGLPLDR